MQTEQQFPSKSILKRLVAQAGGQWCGVQETIPPLPHLLLVTSPKTGSTLAVRFDPKNINRRELVDAIRKRIAESDKTFSRRDK